ncbi:hypothetical protein RchiOBHm_Chr7g0234701 [Rosa chinensis]|uniref:Uncharacterized protein n=1 Tax=Rosa chinensis TaxID=74649 RepID=A0A2P6PGG8_ROSCH|nr:hypothetical protein RchiOBHm_Chr7g0234701 [Rosa chinensis]
MFSALSFPAVSEALIIYSLTLPLPLYCILVRDFMRFPISALSKTLYFSATELKNTFAYSESGMPPLTLSLILFFIMISAILLCLYHFSYFSLLSLLAVGVNSSGGSSFNT